MKRLELSICFFASIAPAMFITQYFTGVQIPALVYAVPIVIYLVLFGKLLFDAIKEDLHD